MNLGKKTPEVEQILKEIEDKHRQIADPNNTICTHCLGLDISDKYRKLEDLGYLPKTERYISTIELKLGRKLE